MWYIIGLIALLFTISKVKSSKKIRSKTESQTPTKSEDVTEDSSNSFFNSKKINEKVSKDNFKIFVNMFNSSKSFIDKHYILQRIIVYLANECERDDSLKDQLLDWCLKDVSLYKDFLIESHYYLFHLDSSGNFILDEDKRREIEKKLTFNKVKKHPDYFVPTMESFFVLSSLYNKEGNVEKLRWIRAIGQEIGMHGNWSAIESTNSLESITHTISIKKSGKKGKLAFLDSQEVPCSTEDAFRDYMTLKKWNVMRAEVVFWQAMFCLSFWEEIFEGTVPIKGQDIPHDLFRGDQFYKKRSKKIDDKYQNIIKLNDIHRFINEQLKKHSGNWTRLLHSGNYNLTQYIETNIVQDFLQVIPPKVFGEITYRIALNPSNNRSGISDFVIWNNLEYKFIETKRIREKVRDEQKAWILWMIDQKIPVEIIRVKGI